MASVPSSPDSESKGVKFFTSHDPACDQCRIKKIGCGREFPTCSNCLKAKLPCSRSNKGKRPNQTNKLVNDFEQFGQRLGALEKNVNSIHERLDEFLRRLPIEHPGGADSKGVAYTAREAATHLSAPRDVVASSPSHAPYPLFAHLTSYSSTPHRSSGTTSLMSLFEEADENINIHLDRLRPRASLRDILAHDRQPERPSPPLLDAFLAFKADVYRGLSLPLHSVDADLSSDGEALLLPPKRLLEPIVEPYFRHISSVAPIIGRLPCLAAIEQYYSPGMDTESMSPAWIILFNYMILFCFVGRYMPLDRPSSDVDIVSVTQFEKPFLANIRRSFTLIDKLVAPKLVNVQALLALTLISQRHFSEHVTQYALNQACFVAKSMGLHRQGQNISGLTAEELDERRRVFSCLFIIDKDVSLLLGTPPNLHIYDCDVPYPLQVTFDLRRRIDSSIILNKIYIMLYSSASCRGSPEQIEASIDELMRDIDKFQHDIENAPPKETDLMHRAWQFLMLEQKHTAHHARLMVLRRSSAPEKAELRLSEARNCIKTIATIHVARTTVGGFMVLRRPFQWRPFAAFFELLPSCLVYPVTSAQLEDLTLLRDLVDMLRVVASADDPSTYCKKLLCIAAACITIADEFVQLCLRHQGLTSTYPAQAPDVNLQRKRKASTALSSPNDNHSGNTPGSFTYQTHQGGQRLMNAPANVAPVINPLIQSIPANPPGAATFANLDYEHFGGNGLTDMFPGWPGASSDSLSFLSEGFFWGGEDVFNSQSGAPP